MYLNFHSHIVDDHPESITFYSIDLRKGESEKSKGHFRCIGVHPWWINQIDTNNYEELRELLSGSEFLCIGEIGLDRSFKSIPFEKQIDIFELQLRIAIERDDKFVVIHCVKAYQDILRCVHNVGFKGALVFHDYNGSPDVTRKLIDRGDYFSYGSKLFNLKTKAMKSLKIIPLERLFIETDDQLEFNIKDAYNRASEVLGLTPSELAKQCLKNFEMLQE